jgi:hypothetical protein
MTWESWIVGWFRLSREENLLLQSLEQVCCQVHHHSRYYYIHFGKPIKFSKRVFTKQFKCQVGKALNLTFRTAQSDTWLVSALLSSHGLTEVSATNNDFNLLWTGSHPRPHTFSSLRSYQRVNHFPRSYELTRKDRLYKNVARLQHCHGSKHFDFLPPSFIMPNEYR